MSGTSPPRAWSLFFTAATHGARSLSSLSRRGHDQPKASKSGKMIAVRASLALLVVVLLAAACGGGGQKVYVQGAYKPKQVVLGAGTPIKDGRWLSYGGSTPRAQGVLLLALHRTPNSATGQNAPETSS